MKIVRFVMVFMFVIGINTMILKAQNHDSKVVKTNSTTQKEGSQSFKVAGNCESCKKRIETAALSVKGVKTANWNMETHLLSVTFKSKIDLNDVQQAVAKAGHDTEKYQAKDAIYNALPMCCKYRK